MSPRKTIVETYFAGFRTSDHAQILACLTDEVAWDLPGFRHRTGKDVFDREIENEQFVGRPTLAVDRLIEDEAATVVVAIGTGSATHTSGDVFRFASCDVFTFSGTLINRVESYLVPLAEGD